MILLLILTGASATATEALVGFSQPVIFFLVGVFTVAIAVEKVGLAERIGRFFLRRSKGKTLGLFWWMVISFPPMALIMPSANSRSLILAEVFDRAFAITGVERGAPIARAVMMALHSLNRLASTALLTGGMTSIVAATFIGDIGWVRWFLLLGLPYYLTLFVGSASLYFWYMRGENIQLSLPEDEDIPMNRGEIRTGLIVLMASALWLSDAVHGLHPAVPAMMAWALLLMPGIGVLEWSDFETRFSWATFFILGASLSLGWTIAHTGAAKWLALNLLSLAPVVADKPYFLLAVILGASIPIRILVPNITGYLAITIPIAIEIGQGGGLNPMVCALGVLLMGDSILFLPRAEPEQPRGLRARAPLGGRNIPLRGIHDGRRLRHDPDDDAPVVANRGPRLADVAKNSLHMRMNFMGNFWRERAPVFVTSIRFPTWRPRIPSAVTTLG